MWVSSKQIHNKQESPSSWEITSESESGVEEMRRDNLLPQNNSKQRRMYCAPKKLQTCSKKVSNLRILWMELQNTSNQSSTSTSTTQSFDLQRKGFVFRPYALTPRVHQQTEQQESCQTCKPLKCLPSKPNYAKLQFHLLCKRTTKATHLFGDLQMTFSFCVIILSGGVHNKVHFQLWLLWFYAHLQTTTHKGKQMNHIALHHRWRKLSRNTLSAVCSNTTTAVVAAAVVCVRETAKFKQKMEMEMEMLYLLTSFLQSIRSPSWSQRVLQEIQLQSRRQIHLERDRPNCKLFRFERWKKGGEREHQQHQQHTYLWFSSIHSRWKKQIDLAHNRILFFSSLIWIQQRWRRRQILSFYSPGEKNRLVLRRHAFMFQLPPTSSRVFSHNCRTILIPRSFFRRQVHCCLQKLVLQTEYFFLLLLRSSSSRRSSISYTIRGLRCDRRRTPNPSLLLLLLQFCSCSRPRFDLGLKFRLDMNLLRWNTRVGLKLRDLKLREGRQQ